MNFRGRRLLLITLAAFAVVAAACGSEDTADLSPASIIDSGAATAEAAGSNRSLPPITASLDDEPAAFLDAIPEIDRKCLEEEWGSDRYTAIRTGEERLSDETLGLFPCIAGDTLLRVMVGGMTAELGGLTAETQECMTQKLSAGSASAIVGQIDSLGAAPSLEDFAGIAMLMITEVIPVTFCLNEDERAVMDAQSQFGASISTLECLYDGTQSLGLDFSSVFQVAPSGFDPPAEYLKLATDCGFDVLEADPTPEPNSRERGIGTPGPEIELIPIPAQ